MAMAMIPMNNENEATTKCTHCNRVIPSPNINLHYAHCLRDLHKCDICGLMVPEERVAEHYIATHVTAVCSLCNEVFNQEVLDVHKRENCPRRMVSCEYCEFPLPAAELSEHQEVCGNRTESCHLCEKYVRLCNKIVHEARCTGTRDDEAEHSRRSRPQESERKQPPRGRWQSLVEKKQPILFAVASTGVAVTLGCLLFSAKK